MGMTLSTRLVSRSRPAWRRALGGLSAAMLGAALMCVVTGSAGAAVAHYPARPGVLPKYVMWDLASDFGITATNPQPDSYGDPGVWSWLQGSNLLHPKTFTPLGTYTNKLFTVTGLDGWQGPFGKPPPLPSLPLISFNASGAIADRSTADSLAFNFWPENVMVMHPAPSSDAIVRWTSPVSMTVTVTVTLAKLDRQCGDGITWRVSDGGVKLVGGAISRGGNPQGAVRTLPVKVGSRLYLEVGPGPGHGYGCDSTGVSLTIEGHS